MRTFEDLLSERIGHALDNRDNARFAAAAAMIAKEAENGLEELRSMARKIERATADMLEEVLLSAADLRDIEAPEPQLPGMPEKKKEDPVRLAARVLLSLSVELSADMEKAGRKVADMVRSFRRATGIGEDKKRGVS